MAEQMRNPCGGIEFTTDPALATPKVLQMMFKHAVQCPLCAQWVHRWRIEAGIMRHDMGGEPGE